MREITHNPFFVLGVPPDATPMEIEREAQKLLGMLELGFPGAGSYDTPVGPQSRGRADVRDASAALRDPKQRLVAELIARQADDIRTAASARRLADAPSTPTLGDAEARATMASLGWGPR